MREADLAISSMNSYGWCLLKLPKALPPTLKNFVRAGREGPQSSSPELFIIMLQNSLGAVTRSENNL